jgi:nitroreductase
MPSAAEQITDALERRFGERVTEFAANDSLELVASMAGRGSCRRFRAQPVSAELVRMLCAIALSSPSKSDLQQRDIIIINDAEQKARLVQLVSEQAWVRGAPALLVFCGNNRRQRQLHEWRRHAFENDHLDAFFNAAVDAGIALSAFVTGAEAIGLGCCPISAVRNRATEVSALLNLPDHVFPVAGLAVGYPEERPSISMRLPLSVTVHEDRYAERASREVIDAYDARRNTVQPYPQQRLSETLGTSDLYGWSEDKARQYSVPERQNFGDFVRSKGFNLK